WLGLKFVNKSNPESASDYAAVYLQTGDIYFGKLDLFPWPRLKNVWYFQKTVDAQNQVQLGILQFKNLFWGPVDEIYLNPKQVVFWTYLKNSSQLVSAFNNPELLKQQPSQSSTPSQNQPQNQNEPKPNELPKNINNQTSTKGQ
ncbi:MAG: hypothetical protein ACPL3E_01845, partial [Minisyncoccia bacterium]